MSKLVVLPAPIAPMPAGATIDVAELMLLEGFQTIPLCLLRISTTNRKRFNLDALQRLAANIKEVGILQPILIRPVRPTAEHPQPFEVVAGERRFRSALIAVMDDAPVIIRRLSDAEAAEIQLLENIQREDPHPLEEAEGYQLLMQNHGYDADQLAERVKKSRAYIYGRLKLCALSTDVREVFLDGDISASTALLIARIPAPSLQKKALQEIIKPQYGSEPLSYRAAAAHIASRYTLDLASAPFNIKDGKLLAAAGNCVKCPKRTGNQPELYPDAKSADVCTDPDCFQEKKAAHYAAIVVAANKRGIPVLEGDQGAATLRDAWSRDSELVTVNVHLSSFDRVAPSTGMSGYIKDRLDASTLPAPAAYIKATNGTIIAAYNRTDMQATLEQHGACESVQAREARLVEESTDPTKAAELTKHQVAEQERIKRREQEKRREAARTAERVTLYRKLRASAKNGLSVTMLRELAKLLALDYTNDYSLPDDLLGPLYTFGGSDKELCAYIDQAEPTEVQLLIMDLLMGEVFSMPSQDPDDDPEPLEAAFQAIISIENIVATPDEIRVTAGEIVASRIDTDELEDADDVLDVIKEHIEYLPQVAAHIINKAPHHIGRVEAAANQLGYVYNHGWRKQATDDDAGTDQVQDDDAAAQLASDDDAGSDQVQHDAAPQLATTPRPTLQVKARPPAAVALGPIIKKKKNRALAVPPNGDLPAGMEFPE